MKTDTLTTEGKQTSKPFLFSPFLLAFVVYKVQSGVGLASFERTIFKDAGHDAWISVLLSGVCVHILISVMLKTLEKFKDKDLFEIQRETCGKWAGNALNILYILYLLIAGMIIMRNYIEMVQVWLFPDIHTWAIALLLACLAIYTITGGIRVLVGTCMLFSLFTLWMIFLLYAPLQYAHWRHLLPIMEANPGKLLRGVKDMSFTMAGFELIYFVYPYIKEKSKASIYAHTGAWLTTTIYTIVILSAISFFSGEELIRSDWATFTMMSTIRFPFLERFEFVGVSIWLLVIIPNMSLYVWAASKGAKKMWPIKQKQAVVPAVLLIFIGSLFFQTRQQIDALNNQFSKFSFYLLFIYPLVLYLVVLLKAGFKKHRNKGEANEA